MDFAIPKDNQLNVRPTSRRKRGMYDRQRMLAQTDNSFVPMSLNDNSSNMSFFLPKDNSRPLTPTKNISTQKNTVKSEQQQTEQSQKRSSSAPAILKHESPDKSEEEELQFHLELGGGGRKSRSKKSLFKKKRTKRKTRRKTRRGYGGKSPKRRWSRKYKLSINCKKPKGFSQNQYCKGRLKRKTKRKLKKRRRTKKRRRR